MKILHTSDWHIGRSFHGQSTVDNLREVLGALVGVVRDRGVDVVAVAGDVFDSATPAAEYYDVLTDVLRDLRAAGAVVVMTSGNHDSATRLGFLSEFMELSGIHIITRHTQHDLPITIHDEHGPVHFYGIPYLEPPLIRHHYPDVSLKNHEQVLGFVMDRVRADLARRGGRSVVLSHCFAVGVEASEVERDITSGGLDYVPVGVFDGPDYVALGHVHGRARLSERVRYSGAPLHYSFGEAHKPRGAWLVELDEHGLVAGGTGAGSDAEWIDLPVPRRLTVLRAPLEELLHDETYIPNTGDWVSAIVTDQTRPIDGMRRLQERFPWCVKLEHSPVTRAADDGTSYTQRLSGKSDHEIIGDFLAFVRNGAGATDFERELVADVLAEQSAAVSDGASAHESAGVADAPRRATRRAAGRDEAA
jgi:exonuclease SbcD